MAMEKWIAAASLGLFAIFSGEMVSIYYYMQQAPEDLESGIVFEPDPKILQFISIGAAPGSVMAAVSFILSRRYGSRQVGGLIVAGGAALLSGMAYCYMIEDSIHPVYVTNATEISPALFMVVSAPVMAFGALLFRIKQRRPKKGYA